jgi:hypothetical protein
MTATNMKFSGFPRYGYAGVFLVLLFWYVNWYGGDGLRTHWAFFPLWLGYLLCFDALAVFRGRKSLIKGNPFRFGGLFLVSIPLWWLFELLNARAGYWIYLPRHVFSPLAYTFWSTLCFSTVVPAIFVTSNFLMSFKWFHKHHLTWRTGRTRSARMVNIITGLKLLAI